LVVTAWVGWFNTLFPFHPLAHTAGGALLVSEMGTSVFILDDVVVTVGDVVVVVSYPDDTSGSPVLVTDAVAVASLLALFEMIATGFCGIFITNCSVSYAFAVFNPRNDW
jgi:hypothetical protein